MTQTTKCSGGFLHRNQRKNLAENLEGLGSLSSEYEFRGDIHTRNSEEEFREKIGGGINNKADCMNVQPLTYTGM